MNARRFSWTLSSVLLFASTTDAPLAAQVRCSFADPLQVHVIFDNSTTVVDSIPDAQNLLATWIEALLRYLRPNDTVHLYGFAFARDSGNSLLPPETIARSDLVPAGVQARSVASRLVERRSNRSDLARVLTEFRTTVPHPERCPGLLLLLSDGSLDLSTRDEPYQAIRSLQATVTAAHENGWSVFALHIDQRTPKAFDSSYRRRHPSAFARDTALGGMDARALLAQAFGVDRVASWQDTRALGAFIYQHPSSAVVRTRRMIWSRARGITIGDLERAGVRSFMYSQTGPAGSNAYLGCGPDVAVDSFHTIVGGQNHCYHILTLPADSVLQSLAGMEAAEFAWIAEPAMVPRVPDFLRHPNEVRVRSPVPGGEECSDDPIDALGDRVVRERDNYVEMRARFVSAPAIIWRDTLYPVKGKNCFALGGDVSIGDSMVHKASQSLHIEFKRYRNGVFQERAHAWVEAKLVPLKWERADVSRIYPFYLVNAEQWYVSGRVQLPASTRTAMLRIPGQAARPLGARPSECGDVRKEMACFGFEVPIVADKPPTRVVVLFSEQENAACHGNGAACVPVVFYHPTLLGVKLLTGSALLMMIFLAGVLAGLGRFVWDLLRGPLPTEPGGPRRMILLQMGMRATRVALTTAFCLLFLTEFVTWASKTSGAGVWGYVIAIGTCLIGVIVTRLVAWPFTSARSPLLTGRREDS
jgi:hypothetical protein